MASAYRSRTVGRSPGDACWAGLTSSSSSSSPAPAAAPAPTPAIGSPLPCRVTTIKTPCPEVVALLPDHLGVAAEPAADAVRVGAQQIRAHGPRRDAVPPSTSLLQSMLDRAPSMGKY